MTVRTSLYAIAVIASFGTAAAQAQTSSPMVMPVVDPGPAPHISIAIDAPPAPLFVDGVVVNVMLAGNDLDAERGGRSILVGSQTMTAITTGNILNGDYTAGAVNLTDNALSNFNGLGNLLINTGAQVSLQTGMNLIINLDQ